MDQNGIKPFSNWLAVSDIDGTLNNKLRRLPPRNLEAIRRFVKELGGNFTLASGRNVASLEKHYRRLPIAGTPAVVLNGAGIFDFESRKMLSFAAIDEKGMDFIGEICERFPALELLIHAADTVYLVRPVFGRIVMWADNLSYQAVKSIREVPRGGWGKVVLAGMSPLVQKARAFVEEQKDLPVLGIPSSVVSFELLAPGTHKGTAVLKLAEMLGIPQAHTAAIGDYFNDYDMLRSVAVPAVCAQAPPEMHKIAAYVSCHCNRGAVADFLAYLEENYT